MTSMSDEGDRTCPLCAEEMDFTDQQLKPCKCGYEICVWCWHHIIEMAEKDGAEGRCPACRSTYDKERIVGMASTCEKEIAEINAERKQKPQKAKPKASVEARKHLVSVRVIQRNLVYIIGLPSALADESMLEHREYFGQYGKVIKVSISRPAGGAPQACHTFSVYITYMKEEEAVRCIQAVHNFMLDGKPLRACFGTTKYCHAWLRNMPCSNPDCFYLHDIGNKEDSFSKDEIISAYTRSRVPQITSSNLQRRSGSTLPPPMDDFCSNGTSTKIIAKSQMNSSAMSSKSSPPNDFGARSNVLPATASWGSRTSHPVSTTQCLQGSPKQVQGIAHHNSNISSAVSSTRQISSARHDGLKHGMFPENHHIEPMDVRSRHAESSKACIDRQSKTSMSNLSDDSVSERQSSAWNDDVTMEPRSPQGGRLTNSNVRLVCVEPPKSYTGNYQETLSNSFTEVDHVASAWDDDDDVITVPTLSKKDEITLNSSYEPVDSLKSVTGNKFEIGITSTNTAGDISHAYENAAKNSSSPAALKDVDEDDIHQENSCSGQGYNTYSSSNADAHFECGTAVNGTIQSLSTDFSLINMDAGSAVCRGMGEFRSSSPNDILAGHPPSGSLFTENHFEPLASLSQKQLSTVHADSCISREPSGWSSDLWKHVSTSNGNGGTGDLEASDNRDLRYSSVIGQASSPCSTQSSYNQNSLCGRQNSYYDTRVPLEEKKAMYSNNAVPLPYVDHDIRCSNEFQNGNHDSTSTHESTCKYQTSLDNQGSNAVGVSELPNINISSGVDMRENTIISDILSMKFDPWEDSLTTHNSLIKILHENNSRDALWKTASSLKGQSQCQSRFSFARSENEPSILSPFSREMETSEVNGVARDPTSFFQNGPTTRNLEPDARLSHVQSVPSSVVSKAKISAPPGFSAPNRAPPPGFSSHDRVHETYNNLSEGLHAFSSVNNQYQMPVSDNGGDVEHIDPAILAAFHKGNFPSRLNSGLCARSLPLDANASDNDSRFQLLMQQPIGGHRTQIISGQAGDSFSPMTDAFYPKQFAGQNYSTVSNFAQMSSQLSWNPYISSNQWNGWNDLQNGSRLGMMELLRNERRGLTEYFPGNEEHKFHVPSSGNFYNRSFGI